MPPIECCVRCAKSLECGQVYSSKTEILRHNMIPHTFSILEAGEKLVVDLPWCRSNPEEVHEKTRILTQDMQYRLTFDGKIIKKGKVGRDFRIEVDLRGQKSGVYTMQVMGNGTTDGGVREFWKQHIFVQTSSRKTPEQIREIANRYAPIFLFSKKEQYFPVALGDLIHSPELLKSNGKISVDSIAGELHVPITELDEFLRHNGHADYLLNQSVFDLDGVFKEIHGDFRRSVVYYSYIEDKNSDRFFINYHTFYAFDPKTGIAKMLNIGPHVFDRESLTMVFRGDGTPESLVLSGHLENQPILFLEKLMIWSTGRVRIPAPDPYGPSVDTHPIVPVAEGSHALYPTAGLYHISLLTELAGHVFRNILQMDTDDDDPREMDTHQVLLPPTMPSDKFANYDLRPLRFDLMRSEPGSASPLYDPSVCALVFSGYWVDVPGLHNERFPPFSRKEMEIEDWIDQAYLWKWEELPPDVLKHNKALSEYIAKHLKSPP